MYKTAWLLLSRIKVFLPIIVAMILNSCGFHLRGSSGNYQLPFNSIYLQCDNVQICANVTSIISTQHLAVVESNPESAVVVVKLSNEQTSREPQMFNAAGRVAAYLLSYRVTATVWYKHDQVGDDTIISSQMLSQYNDSTILANRLEENLYWDRIHQHAGSQLVRRLMHIRLGDSGGK